MLFLTTQLPPPHPHPRPLPERAAAPSRSEPSVLCLLLALAFFGLLDSLRAMPAAQAVSSAQAPPANGPNKFDRVKLKNGDSLVGRITADLDGYVEMELEAGATIGVSRALVASVERNVVEAAKRAAVVRPQSQWFVLHDADGESVGWLHTSVTTSDNGSFAVNEEYEFHNGARRYQITSQCTADAAGHGQSCYYRERVSVPKHARHHSADDDNMASADRIEDERIVEATANGEVLAVQRLDGRGRTDRELPWSGDATFPLLARTLARQSADVVGPVRMFDPAHEQLVVRSFDGTGVRQMVLDGERRRVSVVAEFGDRAGQGDGRPSLGNREWVDANLRTVRRELAGPSLVAVPSSASTARSSVGVHQIDSAIVAEVEGRFGLWIPNPAWQSVEPLPPGHLQLACAAHDAEVRLMLLEHMDAGTQLSTAADAIANWFVLMHPELKIDSRRPVQVRGRDALRLSASDRRNRQKATLDVLPFEDSFLVLVCRAERTAWQELAEDFAFVRRTIELDAAALTPERQGPLSERRGGRMRPKVGPIPAPTPAPRVARQDAPAANVRIPK
ncbi:MAG: hypothetical protein AB8H80_21465 [Planctomycetota bacterium]